MTADRKFPIPEALRDELGLSRPDDAASTVENLGEETDLDALETPEPDGSLPGEDEDNPYQESDEALPDDAEERAISRNLSREGGVFDEG